MTDDALLYRKPKQYSSPSLRKLRARQAVRAAEEFRFLTWPRNDSPVRHDWPMEDIEIELSDDRG